MAAVDIATLGLAVDSSPVERATQALDRFDEKGRSAGDAADAFARAGMAAKTAAELIERAVASAGRQMAQTAQATKQIETAVGGAARKMNEFASEAQAMQRVQRYMDDIASRAAALTRAVDPMVGVQERYNAVLEEASRLYRVGAISASTYAKAVGQARGGYQQVGIERSQAAGVDQSGINRLLGVRDSGSMAGSARESAAAFEEYERSAQRVLALIDPIAAAQDRLNAELAEYRMLADAGYLSTTQLAAAQDMAQASFSRVSLAAGQSGEAMKLSGHEVTNIGMQLNDLGVQLASGSSPFMAIIQQGAQIGQVLGPQGTLGNALRALGPAIVSFIANPITLAVVGLGAAVFAAQKFYGYLTSEGRNVNDVLRDQADILGRFKDRYGELGDAARSYSVESAAILRFSSRQMIEELGKGADEAFADVRKKLRGGSDFLSDFLPSGMLGRSYDKAFAPFVAAMDEFQAQANAGNRDLTGLVETMSTIADTSPDKEVRTLAMEVVKLAEAGVDAEKGIQDLRNVLRQTTPEALALARAARVTRDAWDEFQEMIPDTATQLTKLNDAFNFFMQQPTSIKQAEQAARDYEKAIRDLGQASRDSLSEADFGARTAGMREYERGLAEIREEYMRRREDANRTTGMTPEIEANLKAARALEEQAFRQQAISGPIRDATDAIDEQIAALKIQAGAFGGSFEAMDKAQAAQDLINQYTRAGIPITEELAAQIDKVATNSAKAAQAQRALQLEQEVLFDRAQLFRSPEEQDIASRLRGAQIDPDSLYGRSIADGMRMNQVLEKHIENLDEIRDGAKEAFGSLITGIREGQDAGEIFSNILGGLADKFQEAAEQSLTDVFFGKSGTLGGGLFGSLLGLPGGGAVEKGTMANPMFVSVVGAGGVGGLISSILGGAGGQTGSAGGSVGNIANAILGPTSQGTGASPVGGSDVRSRAWNFWASKGLQPHQIAGVLGNISAESAFRPTAVGDGGKAFGLYQHNSRAPALFSAIGGRGNLGNDLAQHEFAYSELMGPENRAWRALTSARDTREATAAFAGFERPSGFSWANPEGAHNFEGRLAGAEKALQDFSGRVDETTTGIGNFGNTIDDIVSGGNRGAGGIGNGISFGQYSPSVFGGGGNMGVALGPNGPVMTDGNTFAQAAGAQAQGFLGGLGSAFSTIIGGLGQVGQGFLGGFGSIFSSIISGLGSLLGGGGASGGGGGLGGIFSSILGGIGSIFGFASGGHVHGAGSGVSDSILARVSNGEFVVNAHSTSRHLPLLHAINDNRYAGGGYVGSAPPGQSGGMSASPQGLHITVSATVDRNGNIVPIVKSVSRDVARDVSEQTTAAGLNEYDGRLPSRLNDKQQRGAKW